MGQPCANGCARCPGFPAQLGPSPQPKPPAQRTAALRPGASAGMPPRPQGVGLGCIAFKIPMAPRALVRALGQAVQGTVTNTGDNTA